MSLLLEIRENLRNFYSKYEIYITPFLKFLLALLSIMLINGSLGYMKQANNPVIVLVAALMCSFLPVNFIIILSAGFALLHMYAVSIECLLVGFVLFLLLFLLYFRFSPKDSLIVLLLPLFFILKMPYAIPLAAGLVGTPVSVISVSCGVVVYYVVNYIQLNATAISSMDADNAIAKLRYIIDGVINNKAMLVVIIAFAATVIVVYLIRRLSMDHVWTIAVVVGAVLNIVILLVGDLIFEINISILGMIFGTIGSLLLMKVLEFFVFNVDYTRTGYVQFEDDEYYYYVKAVPKNSVPKAEKTVKKITSVL